MPDYPQPSTCILHEDRLKKIETAVAETHADVKVLIGYDGPVGQLGGRVTAVESSTNRAHDRINIIERDSKAEARRLNAIAVKVGGIAAILTTLAATVVGHFVP